MNYSLIRPYSSTGLIYPVGFSGDGLTDNPPPDFVFPTDRDYAKAVAGTVKSYVDWGEDELRTILSVPANTSLQGIKAIIENAAGGSLGSIIAGQIAPGAPSMIVNILSDVLDGVIDVAVDAVGGMIGDAFQVIPVLGQVVGYAIEFVQFIVKAAEGVEIDPEDERAAEEEARTKYNACLQSVCRVEADKCANVRATGMSRDGKVSKTLADTFRPFAYALHTGDTYWNGSKSLPWCGPFPFAALCGGETEGFLWRRAEYNSFVSTMRKKYNDPYLGIPPEAQRRVWKTIKSICQSSNDPRIEMRQVMIGDAGRSIFPLMLDTTFSFYKDNSRRSEKLKRELPGHWTVPFLKDMVAYLSPRCTGGGSSGGAAYVYMGGCGDSGAVDIIGNWDQQTGFMKMFADYDLFLDSNFADSSGRLNSKVMNPVTRAKLGSILKRGRLTIGSKRSGTQSITASHIGRTIFIATAMVAAGYGALRGVKYLAQRSGRGHK